MAIQNGLRDEERLSGRRIPDDEKLRRILDGLVRAEYWMKFKGDGKDRWPPPAGFLKPSR
jgi:hypothetical protein